MRRRNGEKGYGLENIFGLVDVSCPCTTLAASLPGIAACHHQNVDNVGVSQQGLDDSTDHSMLILQSGPELSSENGSISISVATET